MTDLAKRLHVDSRLEFMAVSSYGGTNTTSTGAVKILMDTRATIENQHVLVSFAFYLRVSYPMCRLLRTLLTADSHSSIWLSCFTRVALLPSTYA